MEKRKISKKLGGGADTFAIIIIALWLGAAFLYWAILYGGSANDPDRYKEGYCDDAKAEKEEFPDHDKGA